MDAKLIISFIFLLNLHLNAQDVLFYNAISGGPVQDCYVMIEDAAQKEYHLISDGNGMINATPAVLPVRIFAQHLNYELLDTTFTTWPARIFLKEKAFTLDEMVVTGQYEAQEMSASTFNVTAIDNETITASGTGNVSEVLQFVPGLDIQRDPALSSQSLRLIGMGGNNTKILLDGIPINGRTGTDFDLSQLNVHTIERIEIIEGPMSTEYGSNALAGVVNIITKKDFQHNLRIDLQVLEETVGSAYGLNEGIHDHSINAGLKLSPTASLMGWGGRRDFGGSQVLASGRVRDWDPKEQWHAGVLLKKKVGSSQLSVRTEWFDETIMNAGPVFGPFDQRALDEYYYSNRWLNHLDFGTRIKGFGRLDTKASVSWYRRIKNEYINDLATDETVMATSDGAQDSSYFMAYNLRSHITNRFSDRFRIRYGVDLLYDQAWGGRVEGDGRRDALDAGFFGSFEWKPFSTLKLQPGVRWSYNSRYPAPVIPSMNLKWDILPKLSFRAGYSKGFRAPALRELYFDFVDSSHKIYGNPDLKAERSNFIQGGITWLEKGKGNLEWNVEFSGFMNSAFDQINFAADPNDPTGTTLVNIDHVKTNGLKLEGKIATPVYNFSMSAGFIGYLNPLTEDYDIRKYTNAPYLQAQSSAQIIPKRLNLLLNYRYNARVPIFVLPENETEPTLEYSQPYHWLNASLTYTVNERFTILGTVKNILNVRDINTPRVGGPVHGTGGQQVIGYGRSFGIKMNYSIY